MKNIKLITTIFTVTIISCKSYSQSVNWRKFDTTSTKYVNMNAGFDFGISYGVGFGQTIKSKIPVMIFGSGQLIAGNNALDDFKIKAGAMTELIHKRWFSLSVKVAPVFKHHVTSFVKMTSFGGDFGMTIGYYKPKFYLAAEFNYDQTLATNLIHTDIMKANYPGIKDGWYSATGRVFTQGIQTGFNLRHFDIYLKAGKIFLNKDALIEIPFYAELGANFRF